MTPTWAQIGYLVAAICFILALKGLSSPRTARLGNLIGAAGALIAVVVVLTSAELDNLTPILIAIAVGTAVGFVIARRVQMTAMPQLVALFNGVGGGAAAIVALLELGHVGGRGLSLAAALATLVIGAVSFSGSAVTFAKLQELMTTRPVVLPAGPILFGISIVAALGFAAIAYAEGGSAAAATTAAVISLVLALAVGVLFVLPVGGADVPIVISLLNAFTGIAVAAGGYVLGNTLLLVAGTLVGASGTILTRAMASAMGRSLASILFGAFKGGSTAGSTTESERPVRSSGPGGRRDRARLRPEGDHHPGVRARGGPGPARRARAGRAPAKRGVDVSYAIHPVAGRMPGHMNVLLAEANVPYEQLVEMESVNGQFPRTDVALVVGANDVVNPAARTSPGSPIYGMPILDADKAKSVVFLKRSMRPGFAGIENELLYEPRTTLVFGDAKDSLTKIVAALKSV